MNATYFHLVFTHFPIIGTLIGSALLLWGIIKKQNNTKAIASAVLVLMALIAIPVFLTGEPAEESVEKLAGVSESMIELHEDAAKLAIILMEITGFGALVASIINALKKSGASLAFFIVFVLSLATFGAMAHTGYYGGRIRHTEILNGDNFAAGNAHESNGESDDD